MNTNQVGTCSIEVKSKVKHKLAEFFCNVFVLNFVALLFLYAIFGG